MKANELRIGNYVEFEEKKYMQVSSIHIDNTIRLEIENGSIGCFKCVAPMIKPIPLTEEWLLKFGFELKEDEFQDALLDTLMWDKNSITTIEFSDKHKKLYWHDNYTSIYHQEIKYVHQLQNLYFALTGEELKTK